MDQVETCSPLSSEFYLQPWNCTPGVSPPHISRRRRDPAIRVQTEVGILRVTCVADRSIIIRSHRCVRLLSLSLTTLYRFSHLLLLHAPCVCVCAGRVMKSFQHINPLAWKWIFIVSGETQTEIYFCFHLHARVTYLHSAGHQNDKRERERWNCDFTPTDTQMIGASHVYQLLTAAGVANYQNHRTLSAADVFHPVSR